MIGNFFAVYEIAIWYDIQILFDSTIDNGAEKQILYLH